MVTGNIRSQNQALAYHPIGVIYGRQVSDLSDPAVNTLYHGAVPYLMDSNHSVDIDNEADFLVATAIAEAGLVK